MTELVRVAELTDRGPDVAEDEEAAARCAATTFLITAAVTADVEAVARRIHAASLHPGRPFVHVSAAALPTDPTIFAALCANLLDEAGGGSLLLSNVEDMPAVVQESLIETLARLQSTRDALAAVRLIAGTTALLHDCIANGTFSERLFYRLNIIHIVVAGRSAARDTATVAVAGKRRVARSLVTGDHISEALPLPGAATPRRVGRASQESV